MHGCIHVLFVMIVMIMMIMMRRTTSVYMQPELITARASTSVGSCQGEVDDADDQANVPV